MKKFLATLESLGPIFRCSRSGLVRNDESFLLVSDSDSRNKGFPFRRALSNGESMRMGSNCL